MKKLIYLPGVILAAVSAAYANNAEPLLSPRAQSQIIKTVPAEKTAKTKTSDSCCSTSVVFSPRAASQQTRIVSAGNDPDLVRISSTLSPRAQSQLQDRGGKRFEVAPVK